MRNLFTIDIQRCVLALLVTCTLCMATANAQEAPLNGFVFGVSNDVEITMSDAEVVEILGGSTSNQQSEIQQAVWRFENIQAMDFSRPEFLIANAPDSVNVITSIDITIGDTDFNFGQFALLPEFADLVGAVLPIAGIELPEGITASVLDLNETLVSVGDAAADVLRIDFSGLNAGGLLPGEEFTFVAQLASDTPAPGFPSLDQVLFGLDGDLTNNSQVSVSFADDLTGGTSTDTLTLEDLSFFDPGRLESGHSNIIRFFGTQVVSSFSPPAIPEPTTCVQAAVLLSLAASRRCRLSRC